MQRETEKTQNTSGIQDLSAEECKAVIGGDRVLFNYRFFDNAPVSLSDSVALDDSTKSYTRG